MLVAHNNGEYLVCVYEKDGSAENDLTAFEGWVSICDGFIQTTVTHWMPLPDTPGDTD